MKAAALIRELLVASTLTIVASPVLAATIEVTIDKLVFSPASVAAKVGDTIVWVNKDVFAHTATVKGGWDVMIPPKKSSSMIVKAAGAVDYFCRFHPNMKGHLDVSP
ncbi:MAG: amicyanin [Mesorhizobium sp.]|nr:amicyanin [bacterium M00.F.Ca.ET.205.01.1.1]TGU50711.1 amicyanin [bacterium M00.F.Ca.ET.152.01.1.1]TGV34202.1 amicyanin [Mesorhizobium sp. M00.F.Ca.ET.186.01.1.1]TGZ42132.1 amicyanin [bacterium M00.F.Ca.ET.162.01.1.1]TJW33940.1 MAG: amicyanin [Mesorhizobium sp.]